MSKDPDKEVTESASDERSSEHRRNSGLRVPSDDVPRQGPEASVVSVAPMSEEAKESAPDEADLAHRTDADQEAVPVDPPQRGNGSIPAETEESDAAVPLYQEEDEPTTLHVRTVTRDEMTSDDSSAISQELPDLDERKTVEMRAVDFEELESALDRASPDRTVEAVVKAVEDAVDSGDSVDIPIDEDEPAPSDPPPKRRRAVTMALSEDDLEELIEPTDLSGLGAKLSSGALFDSSSRTSGAKKLSPEGRTEQMAVPADAEALDAVPSAEMPAQEDDPEDTPTPLSLALSSSATASDEDADDEGEDVPAAVAAIEGKISEPAPDAPVEMADATDSGEILEDDMIEEVDEPDVAEVEEVQEAHEAPAPPSPPPAPKAAPRKPPPSPKPGESSKTQGRPRKTKPWFEEIFDEDYLRTLPFLTPQATQAEALFVAGALDVEPNAQLLDVGCGYGRHAMELAARGYQVVALDLSLPLLLRGADEAQRRGLSINFVHGDMRELSFESQFDGAYCLFSTFGYFDDETNKKTAQGIARALKPGARLVIEVLNRDYLIGGLPTRVWWEGDGCVVLEEVEFNYFSSRIESNRSVVFDDGRQLEQEISLRSYSLHEFGKLLYSVGLRVLEISGSMATRGRFFGNHSREIIVIAEKRAPKDRPSSDRMTTVIPGEDPKRS